MAKEVSHEGGLPRCAICTKPTHLGYKVLSFRIRQGLPDEMYHTIMDAGCADSQCTDYSECAPGGPWRVKQRNGVDLSLHPLPNDLES